MVLKLAKRIWKGKRSANATESVLNTYELLENILLCLRPPDLRHARFVSKVWNEVITRSQPLNAEWQYFEKRKLDLLHILLLGVRGVGKRRLVESWLNVYCVNYDPTLEDGPSRKQIMLDRKACMYEVDSFGTDSEYCETLKLPFQTADCYALVYAANSRYSFNHLRECMQTLDSWSGEVMATPWPSQRVTTLEPPRSTLGGVIETKCDAAEYREVRISEGIQLARELGCPFYQTSAKTRWNIDKVFEALGRTCRNAMERAELDKLQTSKTTSSAPLVSQTSTGDMVKSKRYSIRRRMSSFHRRLGGPAGP